MAQNVAQKLISSHLVEGEMKVDEVIGLKIDQTLMQDATGTMVMLELEAMGLERVKTEISVQYIDHNIVQDDFKNAEDHLFLRSACKKFGIWYSRAGNGVSHPIHLERFALPGKTLLGSDSHSCSAGALGMLAIGAGGLEVALAMSGEVFHVKMPKIMGVKVDGKLCDWRSGQNHRILWARPRHPYGLGQNGDCQYGRGAGRDHLDLSFRSYDQTVLKESKARRAVARA